MGLVSKNFDFIFYLTQLPARENFIEILILGYLHLIWHRFNDFAKSEHKRKIED
jgi:hypothetical protein